jgi:pimeloyl-ACP methyl ester carboxylesterase
MFHPQRKTFPTLEVPPWIPARRRESLRDYAARLAATIDPTGPLILCGASLGGMLALEMAPILRPQCVILFGSCRAPSAIHPYLRLAARTGALTPAFLAKPFRTLAFSAGFLLGPIGFAERRLIVKMARTASVEFVLWGLHAIPRWPGPAPSGIPILQVHGRKDRIIRASRTTADLMIDDAGHLVSMSHSAAVNAFIAQHTGIPSRHPSITQSPLTDPQGL